MQISAVITLKVKPRSAPLFASWREKINLAVASFPGFVSMEICPPTLGSGEWTIIQRFVSEEALDAWSQSAVRQQLIEEARPLLIEEIKVVKIPDSHSKENATEVFVTKVSPNMQDAYRAWAIRAQQLEATFPGYLGAYVQAPAATDPHGTWITMLRFDTPAHLNQWLLSTEREQMLKEAESIVEELHSHQVVSPFSGWFSNFSKSTGGAPPVWKQSMLVLLALFPIVMLEMQFFLPLVETLNPSLGTFISLVISVTLISWPLMGLAIAALGWWLNPNPHRKILTNTLGLFVLAGLYLLEIISFWNLV